MPLPIVTDKKKDLLTRIRRAAESKRLPDHLNHVEMEIPNEAIPGNKDHQIEVLHESANIASESNLEDEEIIIYDEETKFRESKMPAITISPDETEYKTQEDSELNQFETTNAQHETQYGINKSFGKVIFNELSSYLRDIQNCDISDEVWLSVDSGILQDKDIIMPLIPFS